MDEKSIVIAGVSEYSQRFVASLPMMIGQEGPQINKGPDKEEQVQHATHLLLCQLVSKALDHCTVDG